MTAEQIEIFGLTVISKYDARTKSHHDAVETEALGQTAIVDLLEMRLEDLLPEPIEDMNVRPRSGRRSRRF